MINKAILFVFFQDILGQVRKFIRGANYEEKISGEELSQSALYLLRTLPAARHAVLEYLCNVFTEAVNSHLLHLQLETTVAGIANWDTKGNTALNARSTCMERDIRPRRHL